MLAKLGYKNTLCTITAVFVLLACCRGASSQVTGPAIHRQFEPAAFPVPAGNTCALHPEGNPDPAETLTVRADADGVLRFLAVRPGLPGSVERLTLECTDDRGIDSTYTVDLHAEETFAPSPFDPVRAGLELRPALAALARRGQQADLPVAHLRSPGTGRAPRKRRGTHSLQGGQRRTRRKA